MASYVTIDGLKKTTVAIKDYVDTNFQKNVDENLLTEDKSIVGAINELSQKTVDITEINIIDGGNANGTD